MNRINNELLTDVIPRAPNPRYTFYYTMGFGPRNPLILLMKIGAIFIIIRRSRVRIPESPPKTQGPRKGAFVF
jgi:hypothetical protein